MFTVIIDTADGAAMYEDAPSEVERMLNRAASHVASGRLVPGEDVPLLDSNGNTVGRAVWDSEG